MNFQDLNVPNEIIEGLKKQNITLPTKIQEEVIPKMLNGDDVAAVSQTGSGKTLAYLIPLFIKADVSLRSTQAIVLTPTHELAVQVYRQAELLSKNSGSGIKSVLVIGGANIARQIEKLREKPQIVIGSSGRILELIKKRKIQAHTVKTIVIDEADRMLDKYNINGVREVIKTTLKDSRQVVVLSASLSKEAMKEAKTLMKAPVKANGEKEMPSGIKHFYVVCEKREKLIMLRKIIAGIKPEKTIAFINDEQTIDEFVEKLRYHGLKVGGIYGEAKKFERKKVIEDFRRGNINLLISSDISARGLDFEGVDCVVNIDVPEEAVFYQHRAGRTGRNGKSGTVVSIITTVDKKWINRYERALNIKINRGKMSFGKLIEFVD